MQREIYRREKFGEYIGALDGRPRYFRSNLVPSLIVNTISLTLPNGAISKSNQFILDDRLRETIYIDVAEEFSEEDPIFRANFASGLVLGALIKNGYRELVNYENRNLKENYVEEISAETAKVIHVWYSSRPPEEIHRRLTLTDDLANARPTVPENAGEMWGMF